MIEHKATPQFWQALEALPEPIQTLAHKNFALLKQNPEHPSLHFKSVGALWSARVGLHYRALAIQRPHGFTWVWIGHHAVYDQMIKG